MNARPPTRTSIVLVCVAAALCVVPTGCSGGLHSDAPASQVYVLRAPTLQRAASPSPEPLGSLQIGRPQSFPGLESERIILVQADHRMSHFAFSRWADDLPEVVEALALETLRSEPAWSSVFDSRSQFPGDYFLQITIRRFEADYSASASKPAIHVSFACSVGRRTDREVLASFEAEGSATAAENRLTTVVAAFEQAANTALATIGERTLEAVRKSKAPSTP